MARISVVFRNKRRDKISTAYRERRALLKAQRVDPNLSPEERALAEYRLQKQPRDAARCRYRNRCTLTGRPRGVFSKFKLGRQKLREKAMSGDAPGLVKSSW